MEKNGWVLRKEISIGNVLTILGVIFASLSAYYSLDKRITMVEEGRARDVAERLVIRAEIDARFNRVDDKLEWIVRNASITKK